MSLTTTPFPPKVLLRVFSGKSKLFVQPFDLLDALAVNIVFILSVLLYCNTSSDTKPDGKQSSLLIIAFRLSRVFTIVQSLVEDSKQKVLQLLNLCEKEKTHCEHKIDILILKVEDLEHEVAYLKEKLKKTEKDNTAYVQQLLEGKTKKLNAKRTQSSQSYCPCRSESFRMTTKQHSMPATVTSNKSCAQITATFVDIESQPLVSKPTITETKGKAKDLDIFAKNLAQSITIDVMNAVNDKSSDQSIDCLNDCSDESLKMISELNEMQSQSNNISVSPSANRLIKPHLNDRHIQSGLHLIQDHNHSNHSQPNQSKTTSRLDSSSAAHQLNDDSDAERMKKVEFTLNTDRDIPLSSL